MEVRFKNGTTKVVEPDLCVFDNEPESKFIKSLCVIPDEDFLVATSLKIKTSEERVLLYRPHDAPGNVVKYGGRTLNGKIDVSFDPLPRDILFVGCGLFYYLCVVKRSFINITDFEGDVPPSPDLRASIDKATLFVSDGPCLADLPEIPLARIFLNLDRWLNFQAYCGISKFGPGRLSSSRVWTEDHQLRTGVHARFERLTRKSDMDYVDLYNLFARAIFGLAAEGRKTPFKVTLLFAAAGWVRVLAYQ